MKLSLYNKKRNFKKTPEPKGKVSNKYKQLFIIQKHAASHLHYDFRLELNGVLVSWAVPKGPCLDPTVKRLAMHVEDHPVEYGNFEGIIPKGEYGGGTVMLWDKGKWIPEDEDPVAAYKKGHLRFSLQAEKLHGRWSLIRFKSADDKSWFLIKGKDEFAKPLKKFDITLEEPNSVKSNMTMDEIAANFNSIWTKKGLTKAKKKPSKKLKNIIKIDLPPSKFPNSIFPELATLVDNAPSGNEWLHEIKFDGYRILAFKNAGAIELMSRNNRDWTPHFNNVYKELKKLNKNVLFDGEIVLLDSNKQSNFQLLQNAIGAKESKPFIYYIFDLLYYDQYNLMALPLLERKNILKQVLESFDSDVLLYSDHIIGNGPEIFSKACEMKLEGIISKNINSPYDQKRSKLWLKTKCSHRQEFVIGGFSPPSGSRAHFGSLYLGYFDNNGRLVFCGNVGTGFNQTSLKTIYALLKKNIITTNPFSTRPPGVTTATWVNPVLVAEVEFTEWTSEGILRHPSFKGLRADKKANAITREVEVKMKKTQSANKPKLTTGQVHLPFKLTNPNKILYVEGKITKKDIAEYYDTIQEWILPYIVQRPLTIVRCPDSYTQCFYQKHVNRTTGKAIYGFPIKEKDKVDNSIYIKDREGLMALVQMGSLEIHPWGSRIEKVEYPDMITIDLDPAPEITWKTIVSTAQMIKKQLKNLNLISFVKTTGGKGLHVVIPIKPNHQWDKVKEFSHAFVDLLVEHNPEAYVSNMSKIKRKGKIFIDYLRNQRGATAIAAYSTRARIHAPVSVPLDWDELTNSRKDTEFTIATLPERLKRLRKDPWQDFFKVKQSLPID